MYLYAARNSLGVLILERCRHYCARFPQMLINHNNLLTREFLLIIRIMRRPLLLQPREISFCFHVGRTMPVDDGGRNVIKILLAQFLLAFSRIINCK